MKNVYLGYDTAWWYWRNSKNAPTTLAKAKRRNRIVDCASSQHAVYNAFGKSTVFADQKLFVLVSKRTFTNTEKITFRHCPSSLPKESFVQLAPSVFIASPELSFLQYAAQNSLISTMEYGFQLCGTFMVDRSSKHGITERSPLTNAKRISAFLNACNGMRGVPAARRAITYIVDNSASPRETAVALILKLPLYMGGYAIPPFSINHELIVPEKLRCLTQRSSLRADFFWKEAQIAAEYDSDTAHMESKELCNDSTKRIALHRMGYTTFAFTRIQVDDLILMDESVAALRHELGIRKPQRLPSDYRRRQIELRSQLGLPTLK